MTQKHLYTGLQKGGVVRCVVCDAKVSSFGTGRHSHAKKHVADGSAEIQVTRFGKESVTEFFVAREAK